jgi:hypothetical protein
VKLPVLLIGPNAPYDLRAQLNAGLIPREQLLDLQHYYQRTGRPELALVVHDVRARLGSTSVVLRDPDWGNFT